MRLRNSRQMLAHIGQRIPLELGPVPRHDFAHLGEVVTGVDQKGIWKILL